MHLDRDGILSILLGIALAGGVFLWEYYTCNCGLVSALISFVLTLIKGIIAATGILLILVGILFMVAW